MKSPRLRRGSIAQALKCSIMGCRSCDEERAVADREAGGPVGLLYDILLRCTASLDLDATLHEVLSLTIQALGARRGSFFLLDPSGRVIHRIGAQPRLDDEEFARRVARVMEEGLAGWAVRHRKVALASDAPSDPRWLHFPDDPREAGSAIAVPLLHRDEVVGVLTLQHSERGFFGPEHAALAQLIARQVAIAVANARLHDAVRRERRLLQELLAALPDAVLLVDEGGTVTFANERAFQVLGGDLVGRPLAERLPDGMMAEPFRAAVEAGEPQQIEVRMGEDRVFDAVLTPVPGLGILIRLQDVTRLRRLDEMRSLVVAAVSHDLRTPLTYVRGFAEVLAGEEGLSETGRRCVEGILVGARRMHRLVERLLDVAREEAAGEAVASHVGPGGGEAVESLAEALREKEQTLTVEVPAALPPVGMDAEDLRRVLTNLVENAVKYTQPGGHIRVTAQVEGKGVRVSVIDNGPGIPEEIINRVFDPYFTTRREGSGLGLAIVKNIVMLHGGTVEVENVPGGNGARFRITIPVERPASGDGKNGKSTEDIRGNKETDEGARTKEGNGAEA